MHQYEVVTRGTPLTNAQKAIILLHGRGASADDILSLADQFPLESAYIVAPQATNYTWYPYGFMAPEKNNEPWLSSAVSTVKRLIDETAAHVPLENIYVMGFSQGACLTLEVTSRFPARYGGVAAFTGGLIGEKLVRERYAGNFGGTPVFIGNSDRDPHVPEERSAASANVMRELGADVLYKVYPGMQHTITMAEVLEVRQHLFSKRGG